MLNCWVSGSRTVLQHLELTQAAPAARKAAAMPVTLPSNCAELGTLLSRLGDRFDASDAWGLFGLAPLDGPWPSEQLLARRATTALSLLDTARGDS